MLCRSCTAGMHSVAVKELKPSYYNKETLLLPYTYILVAYLSCLTTSQYKVVSVSGGFRTFSHGVFLKTMDCARAARDSFYKELFGWHHVG